jgi:hypothetical protein
MRVVSLEHEFRRGSEIFIKNRWDLAVEMGTKYRG